MLIQADNQVDVIYEKICQKAYSPLVYAGIYSIKNDFYWATQANFWKSSPEFVMR